MPGLEPQLPVANVCSRDLRSVCSNTGFDVLRRPKTYLLLCIFGAHIIPFNLKQSLLAILRETQGNARASYTGGSPFESVSSIRHSRKIDQRHKSFRSSSDRFPRSVPRRSLDAFQVLLQFEVVRAFGSEMPGDTSIRHFDIDSDGTTSGIATGATSDHEISAATQCRLPEQLGRIEAKKIVRHISQQIDAVDYWPHLVVVRVR